MGALPAHGAHGATVGEWAAVLKPCCSLAMLVGGRARVRPCSLVAVCLCVAMLSVERVYERWLIEATRACAALSGWQRLLARLWANAMWLVMWVVGGMCVMGFCMRQTKRICLS